MSQFGSTDDWDKYNREFATIVKEITNKLEAGEDVDVAELVDRYPKYADRIEVYEETLQHLSEEGSEAEPAAQI